MEPFVCGLGYERFVVKNLLWSGRYITSLRGRRSLEGGYDCWCGCGDPVWDVDGLAGLMGAILFSLEERLVSCSPKELLPVLPSPKMKRC
jgi:hypothetical protein